MMVPTLIALELFRRFQWSLFRVEWEHIKHSNAGFQVTPVFFDNLREKEERARNLGEEQPNLLAESSIMVIGLLVVAIIAAVIK